MNAPSASSAWFQTTVSLKARARGCHLVTDEIMKHISSELREFKIGMANFFLQHTSASLSINENWDSDVRLDTEDVLNALVPEGSDRYRHSAEGDDDMPAHVKSSLFGVSLNIPVTNGRLAVGTWQGIWLCEHRDSGGSRKVVVTKLKHKEEGRHHVMRAGSLLLPQPEDEEWENAELIEETKEPELWSPIQSLGSTPSRRHSHSAVVYDGKMYVFGGMVDFSTYLNDFYEYNFGNERWSKVKATGRPPSPRHSHTAIVYQDNMYVFGGACEGENDNSIYEFNFEHHSWKKPAVKGGLPAARWGHTAVLNGTCMYIFGGYDHGFTNQFLKFDFVKMKWSIVHHHAGVSPSPRQYHSAVRYRDWMYVFGGHNGKSHRGFYRFSFMTNTWEALPKPHHVKGRSGHIAVRVDNLMTVHGGRDESGVLSDFWAFDFDDGKWRPIKSDDSSPLGRHSHTAIIWNNSLYIFGGLGLKHDDDEKPQSLDGFYQHDCTFEEDDSNPKKMHKRKSDLDSEIPGVNYLKVLPREIAVKIMRYFSPSTLATLCLVSRSWKRFAESDEVWLRLVHDLAQEEKMSSLRVSEEKMSWKNRYKMMVGTFRDFNARRLTAEEEKRLMEVQHDVIRIVVCGRVGCGKSALAIRFSEKEWVHAPEYKPSLNEDNHRLGIIVDEIPLMLEIHSSTLNSSTELQHRQNKHSLEVYDEEMREGDGFLLVYSITDEKSLRETKHFHDRILKVKEMDSVPMMLVGNKRELEAYRVVSPEQGLNLAQQLSIPFVETSAKSGENVDKAFYDTVRQVMRQRGLYKSEKGRAEESRCIIS